MPVIDSLWRMYATAGVVYASVYAGAVWLGASAWVAVVAAGLAMVACLVQLVPQLDAPHPPEP